VGELKPVLQKVDPQHAFNTDRASSCTLRIRIKRRDCFDQSLPGNDSIHILKKLLFTCFLAVFLEAICQGKLFHHRVSEAAERYPYYRSNRRINQSCLNKCQLQINSDIFLYKY